MRRKMSPGRRDKGLRHGTEDSGVARIKIFVAQNLTMSHNQDLSSQKKRDQSQDSFLYDEI